MAKRYDLTERFANNLKAWRQARGLALRPAAEQIGISFNTLSRLEHGQGDFSVLKCMAWMQSDAESDEWRARALNAEMALAAIQCAVHEYEDGPSRV